MKHVFELCEDDTGGRITGHESMTPESRGWEMSHNAPAGIITTVQYANCAINYCCSENSLCVNLADHFTQKLAQPVPVTIGGYGY